MKRLGDPLYGLDDFPWETFRTPTRQVWIHDIDSCRGRCPFHSPSKHHMMWWPMELGDDNKMRRLCPHGVHHPDPDVMSYSETAQAYAIHLCDGCCVPPEFPSLEEISFQLDTLLEKYQ